MSIAIMDKLICLRDVAPKSEQKVIDAVLSCPQDVINLSMLEMSSRCGTSTATIARVCKSLELNGYPELKITLAQQLAETDADTKVTRNEYANNCFTAKDCVTDSIQSIEHALRNVNVNEMELAARSILKAGHIVIVGFNDSHIVSETVRDDLVSVGCLAFSYQDTQTAKGAICCLSHNDVLLCISNQKSSVKVTELAKLAYDNGVNIISISDSLYPPLCRYSSAYLCAFSRKNSPEMNEINVKYAQIAITSSLCVVIRTLLNQRGVPSVYRYFDE